MLKKLKKSLRYTYYNTLRIELAMKKFILEGDYISNPEIDAVWINYHTEEYIKAKRKRIKLEIIIFFLPYKMRWGKGYN